MFLRPFFPVLFCLPLLVSGEEKPGRAGEEGPGKAIGEELPSSGEELPSHVFENPQFLEEFREIEAGVALAFRQHRPARAEALLLRATRIAPNDAGVFYNLACARSRVGKFDLALGDLATSVTLGFLDADHMTADPDLRPLFPFARFHAQVSRARWLGRTLTLPRPPPPGITPRPADGTLALVHESNTVYRFRQGLFSTYFTFPDSLSSEKVATGLSWARRKLRSWYAEGTAAGNVGDLYDNWDRDHSNLGYDQFPQLTRVEYSSDAKRAGLGMGLQLQVFHNAVTIGNSSTAQVGSPYWRSQPRAAYTRPGGAAILHAQYRSNHLYFYPEHKDHDPGHNGENDGYGDVFPANTPYVVISQGSSGSDRPFLEAFAATLAAFHPEVKSSLRDKGLLMPTLQMVFRKSNRNVRNRSDYLSGRAHPTVFDSLQLDAKGMVEAAHAIRTGELPPLVQLQVVEEESPVGTPSEVLFDTPQAISRVFRSHRRSRRMTVSAEPSVCPGGSELTYHWVILRGDPSKISITPKNEASSIVEIEIAHHDRFPVGKGAGISSTRVDIGVFVENPFHLSAPAFVSTFFPENERRVYDEEGRILVLDGNDPGKRDLYVDPLISPPTGWRDEFRYADDGSLTGWTRHWTDREEEYDASGKRILKDPETGETRLEAVRYLLVNSDDPREAPQWRIIGAISGDSSSREGKPAK